MGRDTVELSDYIAIFRRRKMHFFIPLVLVSLVSVGLAFGLPPVFQSTATILVEQQEIPQELVRSTVNSYATERIQLIRKRVLTRDTLWGIINEFDLYADKKEKLHKSELISEVRRNIKVNMVSADVVDQRGRKGKATIAFELSFQSNDPVAAQAVAKRLATLFLDENIRLRTKKAEVTSSFLAEEGSRLSREIETLEERLAAFKERNMGRLPEQMQLNMRLMERTERELEEVERQLYTLEERKLQLESQLSQLEPNTIDSPKGRLKALRAKYLYASSVYAPDHPDVIRMRQEMDVLTKQLGLSSGLEALQEQKAKTSLELTKFQEKYSADHPDVVRLRKMLASIDEKINDAYVGRDEGMVIDMAPDNPVYISVATQLESMKINRRAQLERRDRLREKLTTYEDRLTNIPRVEQEGLIIKRDYNNAVKKYQEIRQKLLQAQIGEQLERESKGERFSLLETPSIPSKPIKPNRLGIALLGVVFSFGGGLGVAAVAEFMDRTVRGAKKVTRLLDAPPLSVIPYRKPLNKTGKKFKLLLFVVILFVVLAASLWLMLSGGM